jgi:hypothetical protein
MASMVRIGVTHVAPRPSAAARPRISTSAANASEVLRKSMRSVTMRNRKTNPTKMLSQNLSITRERITSPPESVAGSNGPGPASGWPSQEGSVRPAATMNRSSAEHRQPIRMSRPTRGSFQLPARSRLHDTIACGQRRRTYGSTDR